MVIFRALLAFFVLSYAGIVAAVTVGRIGEDPPVMILLTEGRVEVLDPTDGSRVTLAGERWPIGRTNLSTDECAVAAVPQNYGRDDIEVWHIPALAEATYATLPTVAGATVDVPQWSPDGQAAAFMIDGRGPVDDELLIWRREQPYLRAGLPQDYYSMHWSARSSGVGIFDSFRPHGSGSFWYDVDAQRLTSLPDPQYPRFDLLDEPVMNGTRWVGPASDSVRLYDGGSFAQLADIRVSDLDRLLPIPGDDETVLALTAYDEERDEATQLLRVNLREESTRLLASFEGSAYMTADSDPVTAEYATVLPAGLTPRLVIVTLADGTQWPIEDVLVSENDRVIWHPDGQTVVLHNENGWHFADAGARTIRQVPGDFLAGYFPLGWLDDDTLLMSGAAFRRTPLNEMFLRVTFRADRAHVAPVLRDRRVTYAVAGWCA